MKRKKLIKVSDQLILDRILLLRNKRVMLDKDLAGLYKVSTKRLNEQVKRNRHRFPKDFMFRLSQIEKEEVVANCDHLKSLKYSPALPYAFTEHGVVMLACILNSERAIKTNILVIRMFNKIREALLNHQDLMSKLEELEKQALKNKEDIQLIFDQIKQIIIPYSHHTRTRIGFKRQGEED